MLVRPEPSQEAAPIWFVTKETWPKIRASLPQPAQAFANACGFEPAPGRSQILPGPGGDIEGVLFGIEGAETHARDLFLPGQLVLSLPPGLYQFATPPHDAALAALSWLLSSYRFHRYKSNRGEPPRLCVPDGIDAARIERIARGVTLGRDLINAPANDMNPEALEAAALTLAAQHHAEAEVTRGDALLEANLPLIHAVGRAAEKEPRLVDFRFGDASSPKVTLVGKGVCFDSGGLDIKPDSAMSLMKKDMGGAATALALASMIMDAGLPIRLRVLIPIVENAISSNAFRPGDIYESHKGLTVEIGNTDAEGRLILADALALADEEAPELLIDFATLTGAARVALGPDLPPFYTMDEALAADIARFGAAAQDPVWRLPLWDPYDKLLEGKIADLNNISGTPFAGSITAALFLRRFVEQAASWMHFDIYAWTPKAKPGRPEGAEVQAARLLYDLLEARYGAQVGKRGKKPPLHTGKIVPAKVDQSNIGREWCCQSKAEPLTQAIDHAGTPIAEEISRVPGAATARLPGIDRMRGLVILLMALDHVRDFFNADALYFDPTDLTRTYPVLFLTRFITHYCAPTFVLLAGVSAFLHGTKLDDRGALARFLLTRGVWLILLDAIVVSPVWALELGRFHLGTLWAIGVSMIALAGLVFLPLRAVLLTGALILVFHNALDSLHAPMFGDWAPLWTILHEPGALPFGMPGGLSYPVLPWSGIMALGYGLGPVFLEPATERARQLTLLGLAAIALFLLLRGTNFYGDPRPWSTQHDSVMTALSMLNVTKYPPSLLYALVTLGPVLLLLPIMERCGGFAGEVLATYGRVPLFIYVLHLYAAHAVAVVLFLTEGFHFEQLRGFGAQAVPPEGLGLGLPATYATWILIMAALYPACRWFANVKRRQQDWWLSYL